MRISFIIASLNDRARQLQSCVDSIVKAYEKKKDSDLEILVVLQKVKERDCDIKTRYPGLIKIYYIEEKGLSRARNYAIGKSRGDLLIFLDDDAMIKNDFLDILSSSPLIASADALCGRVCDQNANRSFSGDKMKYLRRTDFRYFMGSSHILKRSVIDKIGAYDEDFGAGAKYPGAEDSDVFFRLKRRFIKIFYIPEIVFYHDLTLGTKAFEYSYATGAMLAKQIFSGKRYFFVYLRIITGILGKSFMLAMREALFSKNPGPKNTRSYNNRIFLGTLMGIFDYTRQRFFRLSRSL